MKLFGYSITLNFIILIGILYLIMVVSFVIKLLLLLGIKISRTKWYVRLCEGNGIDKISAKFNLPRPRQL